MRSRISLKYGRERYFGITSIDANLQINPKSPYTAPEYYSFGGPF